jgi:hypothetical protein
MQEESYVLNAGMERSRKSGKRINFNNSLLLYNKYLEIPLLHKLYGNISVVDYSSILT